MVEQAIVTALEKEKIIVSMKRRSACGSCWACGMTESGEMTLKLENTVGARKGDTVEIELNDNLILKGAFIIYIIPLAGLMAGLAIGGLVISRYLELPTEAVSASSGILFMAAAAIAARKHNEANKANYRPRIRGKVLKQRG